MSFTMDHQLYGPSAYRKARPASVSSSGFHSQRRRTTYSQLSTVDSLDSYNGDMTKRNEKEILQTLNDRFAGYIEKVRNLEMHNRNLEAEAAALRQSQAGRASVGEHYERELGDLRGLVQQLTGEKASVLLEHEHMEEDIQHVRARFEDEARNREEMEAAARAMNKYVDECGLARLELDKKLRALEEEAVFLKKNHEEEVAELFEQIQGAQVSFEVRDSLKADVTSALREIRAQLDSHASKSSTQAEEWFKVRVDRLSEAARFNHDAIRGSQVEIAEYRRQLQSRTIELETLRGTKESLERQRMESEDRHHGDLNSLQETINQLDNELKSTKWEMASQLREYQELLNVKMALDIEIAAYRKLLEGEETHFLSGGGPYSYLDGRTSAHLKLKGEEMSDTVIVQEQTDETQVIEVTEEADEEEEEGEGEKEAEGEEKGDETKEGGDEGEGEEGGDDKEEEGEEKGEEKVEEEEAGEEKEEKSKSPGKAGSPPSKSPQSKSPPKTPTVKSPESKSPPKSPESKSPAAKSPMPKSPAKSPAVKSPADDTSKSLASKSPESKSPTAKSPPAKSPATKSPVSKSPPSKSPESKSPPPKTPELKSPEQEKAKPPASKEEKKEEQPAPVKEEKKETDQPAPVKEEKKEMDQPAPVKEEKKETDQPATVKEEKKETDQPAAVKEEKKEAPKEKEAESKTDKPDAKKESKAEETSKKADTPKPAAPAAAPSKPAEDKPAPKESPAPAKEEKKPSPPKTDDKAQAVVKPAPKAAAEKTESKKEKKPEEKKEAKDAPKVADSKEVKEGGKTERAEKSSSTDSKESKEEKAKK